MESSQLQFRPVIARTAQLVRRAGAGVDIRPLYEAAALDINAATGANRVSFWRFTKAPERLICELSYNANTGSFATGGEISRDQAEAYFDAIRTETSVMAPDIFNHAHTACLADYARATGVQSLLDYIIHEDYQPIGVVCCEMVGEKKQWRDEDVSLLRQISTLISFSFGR